MRTDYLKRKARKELLAIQARREQEQDDQRLSNPENWQKPRPVALGGVCGCGAAASIIHADVPLCTTCHARTVAQ